MSGRFNGFSQDEIQTIHSKSDVKKTNARMHGSNRANKNVHQTKILEKLTKSEEKPAIGNKTSATETVCDTSNVSNTTVQSLQDALHFKPLPNEQNNFDESDLNAFNGNSNSIEPNGQQLTNNSNNNYVARCNSTESTRSMFQGISLKDFDEHRQMIEESNKEKKEILTRAIEERFEQTTAEARKIAEIKEELDKLDAELAADVTILRREIEAATLQYANYKKNYERIESQFLKAKLELHQSSEKKEMLTEHLCTIISFNEDRKAKKLCELMEKVGLSPQVDQQQKIPITENNLNQ